MWVSFAPLITSNLFLDFYNIYNLWVMGVVSNDSELAFYCDDPSSNPAEVKCSVLSEKTVKKYRKDARIVLIEKCIRCVLMYI